MIVCGSRVARLDVTQVHDVLVAAAAAPSLLDSRPWRFECTATDIELHADRDRALPEHDPDGRELVLACGAALLNLRLAVRGFDLHPHVRLVPEPDRPSLLASVRPQSRRPATEREHQLVAAIDRSRKSPGLFADTPVPTAARAELRRAVEIDQSWLAELAGPQLEGLRDLTRAADTVPGTEISAEDGPLTVVVGSLHDDTRSRLQAGQAVQRVRLTAITTGLAVAFVRTPIAVPAVRAELRELIGGALWPQSVLCVGYSRTK
jgi:hypothetical protein